MPEASRTEQPPEVAAAASAAKSHLVTGPILPTLVGLALPNIIALSTQSLAVIAETGFIGLVGVEALAAMALVFPTIALTQMMSAGAMGGGVSSAVSRALGAGDEARARTLALHAIGIGLLAGVLTSVLFLATRAELFSLLGGRDRVLAFALDYAGAFFAGAVAVWLFNTLLSVVRGTGNMRLPSTCVVLVALVQIVLGGLLSLGLGPFPAFGLVGVALAQVAAHGLGAVFLVWYLLQGRARLRLGFAGARFEPAMARDILKVGAVACLSPLQSILVVVILARMAATYDTSSLAGFGIGVRLELLLVPIAFAVGVACVPMVGMAIGAGDVARARRVAWTGATLAGALIGAIGFLIAMMPWLWGRLFTTDVAVLAAVDTYLGIAGWAFPAYGFGLCLYFASQGSGRILGPVLGGSVRLVLVVAGGMWLLTHNGSFEQLAWLIAGAMLAYGIATALFVHMTSWAPRTPRPPRVAV